jgi:ferredoxin-thioredoxin reductase catalytic subunit/rubredoxin
MITDEKIQNLYKQLATEADAGGYILNPDKDFTRELIRGLLSNEERYGYRACPCRLASGIGEEDTDIICPCDYRDPDLNDHGACYCALYISNEVMRGEKALSSIPERRPAGGQKETSPESVLIKKSPLSYPVWRCKVCGYLCAREKPPLICPICKAGKERFERFM